MRFCTLSCSFLRAPKSKTAKAHKKRKKKLEVKNNIGESGLQLPKEYTSNKLKIVNRIRECLLEKLQ